MNVVSVSNDRMNMLTIFCLAILCWRYFAGDISSVHQLKEIPKKIILRIPRTILVASYF